MLRDQYQYDDGDFKYYQYLLLIELERLFFFFFQAEDGIRDLTVTGVQTCALPICRGCPDRLGERPRRAGRHHGDGLDRRRAARVRRDRARPLRAGRPGYVSREEEQIGRASCRERV